MTATWVQVLHFYQPPTQSHAILRKVANESYRPLVEVLRASRHARVGINMNAVLTEMLMEHGYEDVVEGLAALAAQGRVEFLGSGRFHPILPLIPEAQRRQSIAENIAINMDLFRQSRGPRGFFPPELAYSSDLVDAAAERGHDWILLSGVACVSEWPTNVIYEPTSPRGRTMAVLFRDDVRSNRISFREIDAPGWIEDLAALGRDGDRYVVTAMDAETFGHHIAGWEEVFLAKAYSLLNGPAGVTMSLPSEVVDRFPRRPGVSPQASSWSTTMDDIAAGDPYPLWRSPSNRIHTLQWQYVGHCLAIVEAARPLAGIEGRATTDAVLADDLLQPALHSCQFWWASHRPWWDVPMIRKGLRLLEDALLHGARAVATGPAPVDVKEQVSWRMAAANDIRWQLERELVGHF